MHQIIDRNGRAEALTARCITIGARLVAQRQRKWRLIDSPFVKNMTPSASGYLAALPTQIPEYYVLEINSVGESTRGEITMMNYPDCYAV